MMRREDMVTEMKYTYEEKRKLQRRAFSARSSRPEGDDAYQFYLIVNGWPGNQEAAARALKRLRQEK